MKGSVENAKHFHLALNKTLAGLTIKARRNRLRVMLGSQGRLSNKWNMKTISVVVCARNEEKHIEKCLKALKNQIVKPEIIVVDGHSTDNTVKIAKKYADKIVKDNKKGLGAARNIGWKNALGDIVAYCDADSIPPKDWTKKIIEAFRQKNIQGISGPLIAYDGSFNLKLTIKTWANWFPRFLAKNRLHNCWGANMAFRKLSLKKNPFRYKFLEDYYMGKRLRRKKGMKFINNLIMPISSRRFETAYGFYKVCLADYIGYLVKAELTGKKSAGYYAKTKSPRFYYKLKKLYPGLLH